MAVALKAVGCRVFAVCPPRGHSLPLTRAIEQLFDYAALRPVSSLCASIAASKPDLIVPCDDLAVQHLQELHRRCSQPGSGCDAEMAKLIENSLGSPEFFDVTTRRFELNRAARDLGILVPETALISEPGDLTRFESRQPFPWILKVDGSWGGHGVRIVHSMAEAQRALSDLMAPVGLGAALKRWAVNRDPYWLVHSLRPSTPRVTVQSYIAGRPANSAISSRNGKLLAGLCVEVISALSLTGSSTVVRVIEHRPMMEASQRIAEVLHLTGFYGFDFMIEERTGLSYLIEMNPRCTPLVPFQMGPGRDMVGALCSEISGGACVGRPITTDKTEIAYFPQAWRSNPNSEHLTTGYHDVPWAQTAFVEDLLRIPWPDRSLLARLWNRCRKMTFEDRVAQGIHFDDLGDEDDCGHSEHPANARTGSPKHRARVVRRAVRHLIGARELRAD